MGTHSRASLQSALAIVGIILTATTVWAQSATPQAAAPPPAPAVAADDDEHRSDVFDLLRELRHLPPQTPSEQNGVTWTVSPVFSTKPSTGLKLGIGADTEFDLGNRADTRFSRFTTSLAYSTHKQVSIAENVRIYGPKNHWILDGQNHYSGTSSNDVLLGSSSENTEPDVRYYSMRFVDTLYVETVPNLYVGAGLLYDQQSEISTGLDPAVPSVSSPFLAYSASHGFDPHNQTAAGVGASFIFDNRDNQNDGARGWYALGSYRAYFHDFLGGDSTWKQVYADVRTYLMMTADRRNRLAFWGLADLVTSGSAPYLALPATGGDELGRSSRGFPDGRFRGDRLIYAETEYRGLLTQDGLLGLALFVNMTTVSNRSTGESLFDSVNVAGGGGLRILLRKLSRSNLCVDYAVGTRGSHGFYLSLRDAF